MRTKTIQQELRPLSDSTQQVYLGIGVHTLGLLGWILEQTGCADIWVTTFSTSEEFLSGFFNLRKKDLVSSAVMLADLKASKKTVKLNNLMTQCFDQVFLGSNHSKILIVKNQHWSVSVISSQNNTYGGRNECTFVSTDPELTKNLLEQLQTLLNNSVKINGIHPATATKD